VHKYHSDKIEVHFDLKKCIHAGECVKGLPEVFNTQATPWINPENGGLDDIIETVKKCPSGALQYRVIKSPEKEVADTENTIVIGRHGALQLRGNIEVFNSDGALIEKGTRFTLCRCGSSENKPFCDNSHRKIGFSDAATERDIRIKPNSDSDSNVLKVTVNPGGPYGIEGKVTVKNPDGSVVFEGEKVFLCSCGRSNKKPYCDGTHKQ